MQRDLLEPGQSAYPLIEDYGAIGDGRSVALVSGRTPTSWPCALRPRQLAVRDRLHHDLHHERLGTWWFGAIVGLAHGVVLLFVLLPLIPGDFVVGHSAEAGGTAGVAGPFARLIERIAAIRMSIYRLKCGRAAPAARRRHPLATGAADGTAGRAEAN